ncbi:MAG: D-cysteine desulfhydrase family protein [Pirellulales bacterium]|nr:D-cysteine desulfhydrase family protein [Pirellulales bacterium]
MIADLRNKLAEIPRIRLGNMPTPLVDLPRIAAEYGGPPLGIKRDDLTGLATGGNKTRKLEFLVADAVRRECDCLITAGGPQSNHCRQTAAAAAIAGLECHLVLGGEPQPRVGNLLLDELLGATIHWTPRERRTARMEELAAELTRVGRCPDIIPVGGSNARGALGYVAAMAELVEQLPACGSRAPHLVFPTSSGGTQAGIVLGAKLAGFAGRITAISVDQIPDEYVPDERAEERFLAHVSTVANKAAALLGVPSVLTADDFATNYDYLGAGYGIVGDLEREAIRLLARREGVLVGPVYSGRAFGALLDMARRGAFAEDEAVVFWHTGDESALHAYAADLA